MALETAGKFVQNHGQQGLGLSSTVNRNHSEKLPRLQLRVLELISVRGHIAVCIVLGSRLFDLGQPSSQHPSNAFPGTLLGLC